MPESFEVVRSEAAHWWRTNSAAGALLDRLMLLFIAVPVVLVIQNHFWWSFAVFSGMLPYGFLLRRLAEDRLRRFIAQNPEALDQFEETGVIVRRPGVGAPFQHDTPDPHRWRERR